MKNYTYTSNVAGLVGVDYVGDNKDILGAFSDVVATAAPVSLARINKRQFEKLYSNNCGGLFILSNKMSPSNIWQAPALVDGDHLHLNNVGLDSYLNNYKYYNCDAERGHGLNYYVDINNKLVSMKIDSCKIKLYLD